MEKTKSQIIDDYYSLCELLDDNVTLVSLLIKVQKLRVDRKVLNDIQSLSVEKYNNPIQTLLDMDIKVLRGISCLLNGIAIDFDLQEKVKCVDKDTNIDRFD